jgi:uncharacterized membrane protein
MTFDVKLNVTPHQWNILFAAFALMALDAAISIYGATYYTSSFYEANPMIAAAGAAFSFIPVVIISKVIAAAFVIWCVTYCNHTNSEEWGDMLCMGALIAMVLLLAGLGIVNLCVNF